MNGWTIRSAMWQLFHGEPMSVNTHDAGEWLQTKACLMDQGEIIQAISMLVDETKQLRGTT